MHAVAAHGDRVVAQAVRGLVGIRSGFGPTLLVLLVDVVGARREVGELVLAEAVGDSRGKVAVTRIGVVVEDDRPVRQRHAVVQHAVRVQVLLLVARDADVLEVAEVQRPLETQYSRASRAIDRSNWRACYRPVGGNGDGDSPVARLCPPCWQVFIDEIGRIQGQRYVKRI